MCLVVSTNRVRPRLGCWSLLHKHNVPSIDSRLTTSRRNDCVSNFLILESCELHHLFTSRCKCLLILATKLPILGIILYRKGINPRSLISTIGTHFQRDAPRWCKINLGPSNPCVCILAKQVPVSSARQLPHISSPIHHHDSSSSRPYSLPSSLCRMA